MIPDDTSENGLDPERDLLQRYERMVQTQIETINGIDDKAASVAKLVTTLSGLVLSAVSVAVGTELIELAEGTFFVFLLVGLSVGALVFSLGFAIVTYLSSEFQYGPTAGLGVELAKSSIADDAYEAVLLRGYSEAIENNQAVVVTNARRFSRSLASLLLGVVFLVGSGVVFVLPSGRWIAGVVTIAFIACGYGVAQYIRREEYLTLPR